MPPAKKFTKRFAFPEHGVEVKGRRWTRASLPCGVNDEVSLNKFHQLFGISRQHLTDAIKAGAEGRTGVQHIPPEFVKWSGVQGKTCIVHAGAALAFMSSTRGTTGRAVGGTAAAAMASQRKADQLAAAEAANRAARAGGGRPDATLQAPSDTPGGGGKDDDVDYLRTRPSSQEIWEMTAAEQLRVFLTCPDARADMREAENFQITQETRRTAHLKRFNEQEDTARRLRKSAPVKDLLSVVRLAWVEAMASFKDMETPIAQRCVGICGDSDALLPRLKSSAGKRWKKLAAAAGGEDNLVALFVGAMPGERDFHTGIKSEVAGARIRASGAIDRLRGGGLAAAIAANAEEADRRAGRES